MSAPLVDHKPAAPVAGSVVVVGCGNPAQGDDAAGLEVVRRLQLECHHPRCRFHTITHGGVELLDLLGDAEVLVVVDAMCTGAPAGSLHFLPFPTSMMGSARPPLSGHDWDPFSILELASALGRHLPPVMLLGIEIDAARTGSTLSEPVLRAVQTVVALFPSLVSRLVPQRSAATVPA
jgi:hydrogenase maturation protease